MLSSGKAYFMVTFPFALYIKERISGSQPGDGWSLRISQEESVLEAHCCYTKIVAKAEAVFGSVELKTPAPWVWPSSGLAVAGFLRLTHGRHSLCRELSGMGARDGGHLNPDGLLALVQPLVSVSFPHSVFLSVRRRDNRVILKLKESGVWRDPH